ncbi:MAG: hypothetical protein KDC38_19720, partial [Planctomycetes bacterium]|nr:hypothetical protein [Planctomycetota bacterium]
PLVRSYQTAEIASEVLGVEAAVEITDALVPGAEPAELLATLASIDEERVLCTGHSPNLDRVVAASIGARFGSVFLKKCGTACLDFAWGVAGGPRPGEPKAELLWLLPPRVLRQLGRTPR